MQPAVLPEPGFSWLECHQRRVSVASDNAQLTSAASGPPPRARCSVVARCCVCSALCTGLGEPAWRRCAVVFGWLCGLGFGGQKTSLMSNLEMCGCSLAAL